VLDDYLRLVNTGGLDPYREIDQYGGKTGETLWRHVLNGVFLLDTLAELLGLDDSSTRCLFAAFTVHDLNKVPLYAHLRRPYNEIVTEDNVRQESERLGLARFFPEIARYLADIVTLARLHQGHLAVTGDGLNLRRAENYRIGLAQVLRLGGLMRAADVLDLAHGLDERDHHERFLVYLNEASPVRRFQLLSHRLAENRGLLTNLIHNIVVAEVVDRFGATPVACYPDGVLYVAEAGRSLSWSAAGLPGLAARAADRLARLQRDELASFVRGAPVGIKVDPTCFASGATVEDVLALIRSRVDAKRFSEDWRIERETALREDLGGDLPADFRLPGDDQLRRAELLSAYRILLEDHAEGRLRVLKTNAWERAYGVVGLPNALRRQADRANSFRRAYLLAHAISPSLDELDQLIQTDAREVFGAGGQATEGVDAALTSYLTENLSLSIGNGAPRPFGGHLVRYIGAQFRQCSSCSTSLPSAELMKLTVPPSFGVQAFSNRLAGGVMREPKRNVCPICREQFVLERLAWVSHTDKYGGDISTFYLHLFPVAFFTGDELAVWWQGIVRLRNEEVSALFVDPGAYFRQTRTQPGAPIPVWKAKRNGVAIPRFDEALGNTPTLAVHAPGNSFAEQSLYAVEVGAILGRFFGCKVLVSRNAVPILDAAAMAPLVVDGVPRALRWLLPEDQLDVAGVGRLFDLLALLHQIQDRTRQGTDSTNVVLELCRAAVGDPLGIYYQADRLAERAARGKGDLDLTTRLARQQTAPLLRALLGRAGGNPVEYLNRMARQAAQNYLIGSSFKRSSLLDPFDTALQLTEQYPTTDDREALRGALVTEIFLHLERIADSERKPGRTKREAVKEYVGLYLDGLLARDHRGDVNRLLGRASFLRSAYLYFLQEALDDQRRQREQKQA
jgi:CRISPR-associated protein Csc3